VIFVSGDNNVTVTTGIGSVNPIVRSLYILVDQPSTGYFRLVYVLLGGVGALTNVKGAVEIDVVWHAL